MSTKRLIVPLILFILVLPAFAANEVTLREYLEQRLNLQDKALQLHAADMERRLSGLNELRAEVISDRIQFQPREVSITNWKNFESWKLSISERLTAIETRSVVWTTVIGVFFSVLQIALFIWGRKQRWDDNHCNDYKGGNKDAAN